MPRPSLHEQYLHYYMLFMAFRDLHQPHMTIEEAAQQLNLHISCILAIQQTHYLQGRSSVPRAGNFHVAWEYAQSPSDYHRYTNMLHVSPTVFEVILDLIQDHPVFSNNSNNPQTPVKTQLAVTLFHMGHYGNGASLEDIARQAGISEGSEKEAEKVWMDNHLGFRGTWRKGWAMYDGTIVVLYSKPGLNGDAYFTRKGNYGLNLQVCNKLRASWFCGAKIKFLPTCIRLETYHLICELWIMHMG
ncbi:hypothetical protein PISMIDRAFT_117742 [Pisolithus microcarpus 441]|uniref:Uncharacterized protein n=1 Tax=Pisolithus microcarpus 441 TaxID=765257 RepID=A0A0C9YJS7_9AGAM|nr:hypothetical protein PISMIDRAFT_117742 [Pisolithus microcarpus 441]